MGDTIDVSTGGGGTGDVNGPASSVDSDFAQFDGVTGKLLKDGGFSPSDFEPSDADLSAIAALSGLGFAVRTGSGTWALRTFQNGTNTTVNNPAGTAGNPSIDDTGSGGSSWFPLVDGAEPPGFITDGAGVLIAIAYTP